MMKAYSGTNNHAGRTCSVFLRHIGRVVLAAETECHVGC